MERLLLLRLRAVNCTAEAWVNGVPVLRAAPGRHASLPVHEYLSEGDNALHTVTFDGTRLACDCDHSEHEGICAHVVAVQRLFRVHLPADAVVFPGVAAGATNQQ